MTAERALLHAGGGPRQVRHADPELLRACGAGPEPRRRRAVRSHEGGDAAIAPPDRPVPVELAPRHPDHPANAAPESLHARRTSRVVRFPEVVV